VNCSEEACVFELMNSVAEEKGVIEEKRRKIVERERN